jgi:hypothetical protein
MPFHLFHWEMGCVLIAFCIQAEYLRQQQEWQQQQQLQQQLAQQQAQQQQEEWFRQQQLLQMQQQQQQLVPQPTGFGLVIMMKRIVHKMTLSS